MSVRCTPPATPAGVVQGEGEYTSDALSTGSTGAGVATSLVSGGRDSRRGEDEGSGVRAADQSADGHTWSVLTHGLSRGTMKKNPRAHGGAGKLTTTVSPSPSRPLR
jgi:hypothetical protein